MVDPATLMMLMSMTGQGGQGQQNQGQQNPLAMGGLLGLGKGLEGLGNYAASAPQRKLFGQQMGRQTDLYNLFRWNSGYGEDVIKPEMMNKLLAYWRTAQQPTFNRMGANAARMGSMTSPDIQKMLMSARIAPEANYLGGLQTANLDLTQNRNNALMQALLRLGGA